MLLPKSHFLWRFISHTQWSESIHWKGQDKIQLYIFYYNKCNLKLMNDRSMTLQLKKIPVTSSRSGTVSEWLLRATLPAWETDWTQLYLGRRQHYEFGCSNHRQTHATHAGTLFIVFMLWRHIYCKKHQLTSYSCSLTFSG